VRILDAKKCEQMLEVGRRLRHPERVLTAADMTTNLIKNQFSFRPDGGNDRRGEYTCKCG
jgi:hypothetical protein